MIHRRNRQYEIGKPQNFEARATWLSFSLKVSDGKDCESDNDATVIDNTLTMISIIMRIMSTDK